MIIPMNYKTPSMPATHDGHCLHSDVQQKQRYLGAATKLNLMIEKQEDTSKLTTRIKYGDSGHPLERL